MSHSRVLVGIEIAVVFLAALFSHKLELTMRSSYGPYCSMQFEKKTMTK